MMGMKRSRRAVLLDDILECYVLPRLPSKSHMRFKCVSRRWCDLISNNQFFILQQYRSCTAPSSLLLQTLGESGSISRDRSSAGIRDFPWHFEGFEVEVIGSCNGLIVLECVHRGRWTYDIYVGNPVFQYWKMIPRTEKYYTSGVGLVFDPANSVGYFELVRPYVINGADIKFYDVSEVEECGFKVFSSKTGEWKWSKSRIIVPGPSRIYRNTVYIKW